MTGSGSVKASEDTVPNSLTCQSLDCQAPGKPVLLPTRLAAQAVLARRLRFTYQNPKRKAPGKTVLLALRDMGHALPLPAGPAGQAI